MPVCLPVCCVLEARNSRIHTEDFLEDSEVPRSGLDGPPLRSAPHPGVGPDQPLDLCAERRREERARPKQLQKAVAAVAEAEARRRMRSTAFFLFFFGAFVAWRWQ